MRFDRRHALALIAGGLAMPALAQAPKTEAPMSRLTAYAFSFARLDGGDIRLADFVGKPILVVNTASLCGYTPQYAGLQELWTRFHDRGLMIIGVPSNDFGGQEPGTAADIVATAGSPSRSPPRRSSRARARIRSTNGPPPSGRSKRPAGTSTNI